MRSRWLPFVAVATLGMTACDSKTTSAFDPSIQPQIEVITNCFPNLWTFVDGVIRISDTWQLDGDNNPPDPAELSWSFTGTDITANLTVGSSTITMVISAYGPNGAAEQRNCSTLSGSGPIQPVTSLSEAIDNIATELRNEFNTSNPFLHGVWSISGGGVSATAEGLLGIIGGATNANELEEVRTVVASVTTGAPAVDPSTITDSSSSPNCTLTFETASLITDEEPGQEYPRGTVTITVNDGTTTVNGTITFDKTNTARIEISGLSGAFLLNLDTFAVSASF